MLPTRPDSNNAPIFSFCFILFVYFIFLF